MEGPQLITLYVNRKLHTFIYSLRKAGKGSHVQAKIGDSNSKNYIPSHECSGRATFRCSKCSSFDSIVALCNKERNNKDCWAQYHNKRHFDLPSGQGTSSSAVTDNDFSKLLA